MDGRAFLDVARRLAQRATEADWRTAAGRAYYATFSEARAALERWGFLPRPRDQVHAWVRLRFIYAPDQGLHDIGRTLEELIRLRNEADYQLGTPGRFATAGPTQQAVQDAQAAIALLDQIEADPARRAAAVAAVRATLPP